MIKNRVILIFRFAIINYLLGVTKLHRNCLIFLQWILKAKNIITRLHTNLALNITPNRTQFIKQL